MTAADRELVAVPDAEASMDGESSRYRLGVRPTSPEASFTLGEEGPNGQTFPWIYLRGEGGVAYEIDLLDGELTVTSRPDGSNVQAVIYKIDVESMTGQQVKEGEALRIVFAYDALSIDDTAQVDSWVATTGPRYIEELRTRLGTTDSVVIEMQSDIGAAKEGGRFGEASRAPRSAQPLHASQNFDDVFGEVQADVSLDSNAGMIDLTAAARPKGPLAEASAVLDDAEDGLTGDDPDAIQIVDPATGVTYVGRKWRRGQQTTFRSLKNASYRVAILTLVNGESATVVLQHPKGVPAMQLTTRHGVVRQFLDDKSWDQPLKPGTPLILHVSGPMNGDRPIPRGFIPMAPVAEVAATGPQSTTELSYPKSNALAHFREREQELTNSRSANTRHASTRNAIPRGAPGQNTPTRGLVA